MRGEEDDGIVHSEGSASDAEVDLVAARRGPRRQRRGAGSAVGSEVGTSSSIDGDSDAPDDGPPILRDPDPGPDQGPQDPESDSAVGSSDHAEMLPPPVLLFRFEGYVFELKYAYEHPGVEVGCDTEGHTKCKKWRGLGPAQTRTYGEWESVCYLLAWLRLGRDLLDRPAHRDVPIPWERVEEAHEDIVAEMLARAAAA